MARALPEVVTVPPVSVEGTATSQVGIMGGGWWVVAWGWGCGGGCRYIGRGVAIPRWRGQTFSRHSRPMR